jgi:hypothetical protein
VSERRAPPPARWRAARRRGFVAACAVTLAAAPARLYAQTDALTVAEVLELLRAGVSTRQILRTALEYCVAFTVTDSTERELVASGADTTLLGGIRRSCVVTAPVQLPPGVLVDDDFTAMLTAGRFDAPDRLCTARAHGGGMRVENRRYERDCAVGYPFDLGGASMRIELTIAELEGGPGAMAILGFGKSSGSWDQYSFSITTHKRFELCLTTGGQCRRLLFERVGAIRPGPGSENRIAVEIRRREIILYINEERVGTYVADGEVAGDLSVGVGARTSAVFTRLRIQHIGGLASSQ